MAKQERSTSGSVSTSKGELGGSGVGRDNRVEAAFWLSHRSGPFLIHVNGKGCEPQTADNPGYLDNEETAIEQGFARCPRCFV